LIGYTPLRATGGGMNQSKIDVGGSNYTVLHEGNLLHRTDRPISVNLGDRRALHRYDHTLGKGGNSKVLSWTDKYGAAYLRKYDTGHANSAHGNYHDNGRVLVNNALVLGYPNVSHNLVVDYDGNYANLHLHNRLMWTVKYSGDYLDCILNKQANAGPNYGTRMFIQSESYNNGSHAQLILGVGGHNDLRSTFTHYRSDNSL
jgi:hypothetical protein